MSDSLNLQGRDFFPLFGALGYMLRNESVKFYSNNSEVNKKYVEREMKLAGFIFYNSALVFGAMIGVANLERILK